MFWFWPKIQPIEGGLFLNFVENFCLFYNRVTNRMIAVIATTIAATILNTNILQPRGIRIPQ